MYFYVNCTYIKQSKNILLADWFEKNKSNFIYREFNCLQCFFFSFGNVINKTQSFIQHFLINCGLNINLYLPSVEHQITYKVHVWVSVAAIN